MTQSKTQPQKCNARISFIGGGNMAKAMIAGIVKSKLLGKKDIYISDCQDDNQAAVDLGDYIFLTVKPQNYDEVLKNLKATAGKVFITVAPGITIDYVATILKGGKVIRTMPNTPALVGQGVTAICYGDNISEKEFEFVTKLLTSFSSVYKIKEEQMDAIVAISGSSPAYAYMLIEAMANFGAKNGINRDIAIKMAAQTVLGAATMVLASDERIETLRERVCSKGGTTIKAVEKLNELNFGQAIEQAMTECTKQAKRLSKTIDK